MTLNHLLERANAQIIRRWFARGAENLPQAAQRPGFQDLRQRVREAGTDNRTWFGEDYTSEGGLYLQQRTDEFAALCLLLKQRGPFRRYVEIGSASGGTCLFLHREVGLESVLSLDNGEHPRAPEQDRNFGQIGSIRRYIGDSHAPAAYEFLQVNLDGPLDVAFIDGDHSYEGVWQDLQLTLPFTRPGTLVIFHDTRASVGVERAWLRCLRERILVPIAEYVAPIRPMGIAVGAVPEKP